ncbi:MAG TPA: hypothetical protein VHL34_13690 [Rhizomicrobium sp.]|jgi:hypothetical protein|nr:hypothetical protein [Pseudolabrys sp.]HEX2592550.1 hypothetical protein [Rhizomicrobium sp.]
MVEQKAKLLGRIYDHVELALWASLLAGVAVFAVFVVPGLPAAQQRNEAERVAAFEHECEFYCTKWGLERGTHRYATCVSDLHQFRTSVAKQLAADDF